MPRMTKKRMVPAGRASHFESRLSLESLEYRANVMELEQRR